MTQEKPTSGLSEETRKKIAEANRQDRDRREARIERAKQLGKTLDAALVAITGFPPGIQSDPAVYRSNRDGSYFMVAGKKGEVARDDDPEEIRKSAKRLYSVPLDYIGDYVIVRFNFKRRIEEGGLFYTPGGYIEGKRYNPESDPPLIAP
jgi:hypothetical protein